MGHKPCDRRLIKNSSLNVGLFLGEKKKRTDSRPYSFVILFIVPSDVKRMSLYLYESHM